jgi:hypothetical protein
LPRDGLALLLNAEFQPEPLPPVAVAARKPAAHLAALARGDGGAVDAGALAPLLGLGPGLTPSGDDFLAGALVALHLAGETALRDALWAAVAPLAPERTSDVSLGHLTAAAAGRADGALHALLDDVIAGQTAAMAERVRAVTAVGHTSGWDALSGAVTVLEGLLARRGHGAAATCPR